MSPLVGIRVAILFSFVGFYIQKVRFLSTKYVLVFVVRPIDRTSVKPGIF